MRADAKSTALLSPLHLSLTARSHGSSRKVHATWHLSHNYAREGLILPLARLLWL